MGPSQRCSCGSITSAAHVGTSDACGCHMGPSVGATAAGSGLGAGPTLVGGSCGPYAPAPSPTQSVMNTLNRDRTQ